MIETRNITYAPINVDDVIDRMTAGIASLSPGAYCFISAGEASPRFWNRLAPVIRESRSANHCSYRCVVGPVVETDVSGGVNPLVALAYDLTIDLYVSPTPLEWHGCLMGSVGSGGAAVADNLVWFYDELTHLPLDQNQFGATYRRCDIGVPQLPVAFVHYFDVVSRLAVINPSPRHDVIQLAGPEFRLLMNAIKQCGTGTCRYHDLTGEKILALSKSGAAQQLPGGPSDESDQSHTADNLTFTVSDLLARRQEITRGVVRGYVRRYPELRQSVFDELRDILPAPYLASILDDDDSRSSTSDIQYPAEIEAHARSLGVYGALKKATRIVNREIRPLRLSAFYETDPDDGWQKAIRLEATVNDPVEEVAKADRRIRSLLREHIPPPDLAHLYVDFKFD